jgi:3-oxoacyl-(acyl-carrier-protein) synthase
MVIALKKALKDACMDPSQVDYICSHAHSSVVLDVKETKARASCKSFRKMKRKNLLRRNLRGLGPNFSSPFL